MRPLLTSRPVALAAGLVSLALLGAACAATPPEAAPVTTAPQPTEAPATTSERRPGTTAGTVPDDPEAALRAEVETLSAFVEEARGLEFKEPVPVHLADDAEFEELLLATMTEEDYLDLENSVAGLEALGLVEPGTDLREAFDDMLGAGVLGYYDTEANELVVRGAELDLLARSTLVHELVHALDDQHFELDRPEIDEATDESGFGFSAVVEGNAMFVEGQWRDTLTEAEREERDDAELDMGMEQASRMLAVPPIMLDLLTAPYLLGQPFVSDLYDEGGLDAIDAAFESVPTTSEQIMHIEAFLAGEPAMDVAPPTAEGEVIDEGTFGEYATVLVLGDVTGGRTARRAAEGWGGDHYVVWRTPDGTACTAITWTMESPEELAELEAALDEWLLERDDATVTPVDDRTTTLRSCADSPGTPSTTDAPSGAGEAAAARPGAGGTVASISRHLLP